MSFLKRLFGGVFKPSVEPQYNEFRKAAEQGNATAQYNLGICYEYGKGVKKDLREAVKCYRKAAEQGIFQTQFALGICYANGEGVGQDPDEAVKWYRKAAEQGDAEAQYAVGFSYAQGEGVEHDPHEAVKWYRKAAEQGDAAAKKALEVIREGMSEEERREVRETLEGMRGKGLAATGSACQTVPCSECGDWRGMVPYYKCPKCSTDVTFSLNDVYQHSIDFRII